MIFSKLLLRQYQRKKPNTTLLFTIDKYITKHVPKLLLFQSAVFCQVIVISFLNALLIVFFKAIET